MTMVLRGHVKYQILYISTFTRPMVTKHGEVIPLKTEYNPLSMCLGEVTWQVQNIISPISQCLWSQDLSLWRHTARISHP